MNRCCPWRKAAAEEMEFLTSILGCVSLNVPLNLDFFRQLGGGLIYSYYHYTVISIPILCYSIDSVHEEVSHVLSLPVFQFCPLSVLSISPVHHHLCPPSVLSITSPVQQFCLVQSFPCKLLSVWSTCLSFIGMISF